MKLTKEHTNSQGNGIYKVFAAVASVAFFMFGLATLGAAVTVLENYFLIIPGLASLAVGCRFAAKCFN